MFRIALAAVPAILVPFATMSWAAQPIYLTTNVSTCQTIKGKPLRTGSIVLSCPIDFAVMDLVFQPHLWTTYRDSTGTGGKASVEARLVATDKNTGTRFSVLLFDSDLLAATGVNRAQGNTGIDLSGFFTQAYTIEITLKRSNTAQSVEMFAYEYAPVAG